MMRGGIGFEFGVDGVKQGGRMSAFDGGVSTIRHVRQDGAGSDDLDLYQGGHNGNAEGSRSQHPANPL